MPAEGEAFVDTNVLVYALSRDEPAKQRVARQIVAQGFETGNYVVSTQVLLELFAVITRKAQVRLPASEAADYVRQFRAWRVVDADGDLVEGAIRLAARYDISVWDAAVLQAARQAGCRTVLSEDLSSRQLYAGLRIENPFLDLKHVKE